MTPMPEHKIAQFDLLPPVRGTCLDGNGRAQPLTGGVARFHMFSSGGELLIDGAATITDALAGKVQYDWVAGDTDVAGIFLCHFKIIFAGVKPLTVPNDGYGRVVITAEGG